jgi:hypothetical protein
MDYMLCCGSSPKEEERDPVALNARVGGMFRHALCNELGYDVTIVDEYLGADRYVARKIGHDRLNNTDDGSVQDWVQADKEALSSVMYDTQEVDIGDAHVFTTTADSDVHALIVVVPATEKTFVTVMMGVLDAILDDLFAK